MGSCSVFAFNSSGRGYLWPFSQLAAKKFVDHRALLGLARVEGLETILRSGVTMLRGAAMTNDPFSA